MTSAGETVGDVAWLTGAARADGHGHGGAAQAVSTPAYVAQADHDVLSNADTPLEGGGGGASKGRSAWDRRWQLRAAGTRLLGSTPEAGTPKSTFAWFRHPKASAHGSGIIPHPVLQFRTTVVISRRALRVHVYRQPRQSIFIELYWYRSINSVCRNGILLRSSFEWLSSTVQ